MTTRIKLIPIYMSNGELGAFLAYPYIYSAGGEWIGWVSADRQVFSVHGHLAGYLSKEPRILRKREVGFIVERREPPPPPPAIRLPARVPLAPIMPEIAQNIIDVLLEAPELLPPLDAGELREDLD